ncbi:MAG: prepilin peptidase [Candidatus Saccharimonadales bacterium]
MEFVIYFALIILGATFGSFAGATVWRLRARQLKHDKKLGEKVDEKEYKKLLPLAKVKLSKDHSHCLHCDYQLKWYDLVPIVSWLSLKGKCRHCRKPIGYFELLIELSVAAFFVVSYALWPFDLNTSLETARFFIWLASGVVLAMLAAYDIKWFLLPDKLNIVLAGLGVATVVIATQQSHDALATVLSAAGGVGILSGLYLVLYVVSKGRWVGLGDVKLGIGLALLLIDWQLALVALFMANLIGCFIVIPLLVTKKLKRNSRVPFGPLLIAGTIVAQLIGTGIVSLYLSTLI